MGYMIMVSAPGRGDSLGDTLYVAACHEISVTDKVLVQMVIVVFRAAEHSKNDSKQYRLLDYEATYWITKHVLARRSTEWEEAESPRCLVDGYKSKGQLLNI